MTSHWPPPHVPPWYADLPAGAEVRRAVLERIETLMLEPPMLRGQAYRAGWQDALAKVKEILA